MSAASQVSLKDIPKVLHKLSEADLRALEAQLIKLETLKVLSYFGKYKLAIMSFFGLAFR